MQPPARHWLIPLAALLFAGCRGGEPEVLLAFSVHLEGWNLDADAVVLDYLDQIDQTAGVFDDYGGKLTLETGVLLPRALELDDEAFARLVDRGHAVGIHADMGLDAEVQPYEDLRDALIRFRESLALQGVDAEHVSGVCSNVDWVQAVADAGMGAVSGATLRCARALDEALQPEGLGDCEDALECHHPWPGEFEDRLHPWRMGGGDDWIVPDPDGPVVMVPTATGLPCNDEVLEDPTATVCAFTEADVDLWFEHLDAAREAAEPGELTVLKGTISMGPVLDRALLLDMLERLERDRRRGRVAWATVPEIVERFEELEGTNP